MSREILRSLTIGRESVFEFPTNAKLLSAKTSISITAERDGMKFKTEKLSPTTLKVMRYE